MNLKPLIICAVIFVLASVSPLGLRVANAVPILQLYLEGGTYNYETESWELTPPGSSAGDPFRLWAIGNVDGPGGKGTIKDVKLSAAFSQEALLAGLTISITSSTTGGLGGFFDPSTPIDPIAGSIVTDDSSPILGDGTSLPTHGIYGPGTVWQEFLLGDFTLPPDSPVADFIGEFPTLPADPLAAGQINVYDISVLNGHGFTVHFDLYDTIVAKNDAKFAPFSHDADGDANIVPEPSSLVVWSLFCAIGIAVHRWRRRKAS